MGWRSFALVLLLTAAPAAAQSSASAGLGRQVYSALEGDGTSAASIGALLRDSINSLEGICLNVASYQIFRQTADTATLKVECGGRPLYLLSVDDRGRMLLSGGDGRVGPMEGMDGPVVVTGIAHQEAEKSAAVASPGSEGLVSDPRTNDEIPVAEVEAPDPDEEAAGRPRGWMRWVFAALLATVGLVAVMAYGRLSRRARKVGGSRQAPYTSVDKDRMIAEGRQIAPDLWVHPSGLHIVRGRRGKRRLFPNRFYAALYRRWGIKISQVR